MSYLVNQTRAASLTIGGVDYTEVLLDWNASDSTANKNGCIRTQGTVVLGWKPGSSVVEDYDRDRFRRGTPVILDVVTPEGAVARHPRGLLYVVTTAYDIETETLNIEIACRLSLLALTEDSADNKLDELRALVPLNLDTAQETFSACCAGFATMGQYIYQDNSGSFQIGEFWDGDDTYSTRPGDWVSILGTTTVSASPLAGTEAIPDRLTLSYQVPVGDSNGDNLGRVDLTETTSYYFLQYPVVMYQRVNSNANADNPNGTIDNVDNVTTSDSFQLVTSSSCGNTPSAPPQVEQPDACNSGYELVQSPVYLPAVRKDKSRTEYSGPAAQVSRVRSETRGPRLEANQQYFADSYAYCRQTWSTACNPNGNCPYLGMDEILLGYTETVNYFGDANEVTRQVVDTYSTLVSAAQPSDWRAGNSNGRIQNFDDSLQTNNTMYRSQRTDTTFTQEGNTNVQTTVTYQSVTARGIGIKGGQNLDAMAGVETKTVRRSTTITTLDVQPDIANSPLSSTKQEDRTIVLFTGRFTTPPDESGPYQVNEQMPLPLLLDSRSQINNAVDSYSNYITRFIKGDAFGLQITEALRSEVLQGWYPGQPFRYYDEKKNTLLAMRMDATTWGVSPTEAAFVTNGMWNGVSNGTVVLPDNLVGNSLPDMGDGAQPPSEIVDPEVDDENSVDSGTFAWVVDVFISTGVQAATFTPDGVQLPQPKEDNYVDYKTTFVTYVSGLVVEAGDLLDANGDGSIPIDLAGSLVVNDATVVIGDLFEGYTGNSGGGGTGSTSTSGSGNGSSSDGNPTGGY